MSLELSVPFGPFSEDERVGYYEAYHAWSPVSLREALAASSDVWLSVRLEPVAEGWSAVVVFRLGDDEGEHCNEVSAATEVLKGNLVGTTEVLSFPDVAAVAAADYDLAVALLLALAFTRDAGERGWFVRQVH